MLIFMFIIVILTTTVVIVHRHYRYVNIGPWLCLLMTIIVDGCNNFWCFFYHSITNSFHLLVTHMLWLDWDLFCICLCFITLLDAHLHIDHWYDSCRYTLSIWLLSLWSYFYQCLQVYQDFDWLWLVVLCCDIVFKIECLISFIAFHSMRWLDLALLSMHLYFITL